MKDFIGVRGLDPKCSGLGLGLDHGVLEHIPELYAILSATT